MTDIAESGSGLEHLELLCEQFYGAELATSPADLHGMVCGVICGGAGISLDVLATRLLDLVGVPAAQRAELTTHLARFIDEAGAALAREELDFQLLIPDDDDSALAARAMALGQWCQGFLAGFGTSGREAGPGGQNGSESQEDDVTTVLKDFAAIAQVDFDVDDLDEEEWHFFRIREYVRMGVLSVFLDRTGVPGQASANPGETH